MRKSVIEVVVVAAMLVVGAPRARASKIETANIHTFVIDETTDGFCTTPFPCSFDPGNLGAPATGNADFTPIGLPWTFGFQTGNAITSCIASFPGDCGGAIYTATFGRGGFFDMTGPSGLTFTGVVTGGNVAAQGLGKNLGDVSYFGQWSDGVHGFGTASFALNEPLNIGFVHLDSNGVVPEPSTMLLFGSGLLLLGMIVHRKQLHAKTRNVGMIDVA